MTETLADVMRAIMERHNVTTGAAIARLAASKDLRLTTAVANKMIRNNWPHEITLPTIRALHELSGWTEERIALAGNARPPGRPFSDDLPPGSDQLTDRQRLALVEVIRAMLDPATQVPDLSAQDLEPVDLPEDTDGPGRQRQLRSVRKSNGRRRAPGAGAHG